MKRKIIFFIICIGFIVIGFLKVTDLSTMSFMILPLSLLGNLLRWMSLEGTGGNVLSVLLYLLLVSLPLVYLGINIKKKKFNKIDYTFLPIITIMMAYILYYFINPHVLFGMTNAVIQQHLTGEDLKNLEVILLSGVAYIFYIVIVIYLLLKLSHNKFLGQISFFKILIDIAIIIYAFSILAIGLSSSITLYQNTVVEIEKALIVFKYIAEIALFGITVYLFELFKNFIVELDKDGFQDTLLISLAKLQSLSLVLLIGTLALQGIINLIQFLIMSQLNDVNFVFDLPIGMMIILLMILIFSRYVSRVIKMKKENELII